MKCAAFERDVADWTTGRLTPKTAQKMRAHCARCPFCQEKMRGERLLQQRWQALPAPVFLPEISPRLRERIAAGSTPRRSAHLPVRAFGSLLMAGLCFLLIRAHRPAAPAAEAPMSVAAGPKIADENSLAGRVERMRAAPAEENDSFLAETQQRHDAQRLALLGKDAP